MKKDRGDLVSVSGQAARRTVGYCSGRSAAHVLRRFCGLLTIACCAAALLTTAILVPASWAVDTRIAKLELKFFRHDYPKDSPSSRLERLEKLIFGEARSGSEPDRLARLMAAVPTFDSTPTADRTNLRRSTAYHRHPILREERDLRPEPEPEPRTEEQRTATASSFTPPASSKYPAISAIEKNKFGKDFNHEHVTARLDRLEKYVYGRTFDKDDLGERVDRLRSKTGVDIATQVPTHYAPSIDAASRSSSPPPRQVAQKRGNESRAPADKVSEWQDPRLLTHRWSPTFSRWEPLQTPPPFSVFPPRITPPLTVELGPGVEEYSFEAGQRRRALQRAARSNSRARRGAPMPQRQPGRRGPTSLTGQAYARPRPPMNFVNRAPREARRQPVAPPAVAPPVAYGYNQQWTHPYGGYGDQAPRVYRSAPPYAAPHHPTYASSLPVALIPHVTALELRQFGIAYPWDTLPQRIGRLEAAMLPAEPSRSDRSLPDRLARLVQMLPYGRWGGPLMAEQYRN